MSTPSPRVVSRVVAVCIPILLLVTLVAWAYASTVGSSPDDNFHLPSIWCGQGLREGLCQESGDPATRLVPAALLDATCYAFHSEISGACWDPVAQGLAEATVLNTNGSYPPLFYAAMSILAGPDVQTSVLLMRVANAALAVGLLTVTYFALPRFLRAALLAPTLVAVVPLGLFVVASNNPSSWALVSAAMVWVCLYGALRSTGRREIVLCILAVVGGVIGAGARSDAAAFAGFGVVLAFILGARRGRALLYPAVAGTLIAVIAVAFYQSGGQGRVVLTPLGVEGPPLTTADHISNLLGVPGLWIGVFGTAGLGWLDTIMPVVVPVLAFGAFCAAVIVGMRQVGWRRAIALGVVVAALWAVPFVKLAQTGVHVADNLVQPRYVLPLMIILLGVASATPTARRDWSVPRVITVGSALSIAAALALHINIRRYTTGSDQPSIDPGAEAEWWWAGVPAPMVVWIVGALSFTLVFVLLAVLRSVRHEVPDSTPTPPKESAVELLASGELGGLAERQPPDAFAH